MMTDKRVACCKKCGKPTIGKKMIGRVTVALCDACKDGVVAKFNDSCIETDHPSKAHIAVRKKWGGLGQVEGR